MCVCHRMNTCGHMSRGVESVCTCICMYIVRCLLLRRCHSNLAPLHLSIQHAFCCMLLHTLRHVMSAPCHSFAVHVLCCAAVCGCVGVLLFTPCRVRRRHGHAPTTHGHTSSPLVWTSLLELPLSCGFLPPIFHTRSDIASRDMYTFPVLVL